MDTARMVEDLMEVERIPVRRMERDVETYEDQRVVWQDLGRQLSQLRDAARTLYSFENPFRERIATSSDESVLTATASRQATEGLEEIVVLQTAGRDRFASNPFARDYEIPAGRYEFMLGEETASVRFAGGGARAFAEAVNRGAAEVVRVSVVPNTAETQVLVFEGREEGAAATLSFAGASTALVEEIGVMSPERPDRSLSYFSDMPLRLEPGQSDRIRLDSRFALDPGMVLRFEVRTEAIDSEAWEPPPVPTGPDTPDPGSVTFGGITLRNDELPLDLPEPPVAEPPEVVEDNRVVAVTGGGRSVELPPLPVSATYSQVEIAAADLPSAIDGFTFTNRNTGRAIEIQSLEVLDPTARGGARPTNVIAAARDARVLYSGIEVQRPSNEIEDLIPGVTLSLRRSSEEPVEVAVEPDRETAKDAIIQFVGFYNQVVRDINIYTRNEPGLIDQIEYFDESERETMQERLGMFQGDSALNTLRTRLQTVMMNPYDTGLDGSFSLLAELGISTNASGGGGGFDATRLRGYLEINESVLDEALARDFESAGSLFGRDTTGDLVRNSGVAVALDSFVAPYVTTGGVVSTRTQGLDTRIDRTETQISRYNDRLEDYEQQLRNDFGRMESTLGGLQDIGSQLDSLPSLGGNDR